VFEDLIGDDNIKEAIAERRRFAGADGRNAVSELCCGYGEVIAGRADAKVGIDAVSVVAACFSEGCDVGDAAAEVEEAAWWGA
jgi:hypothetical protein